MLQVPVTLTTAILLVAIAAATSVRAALTRSSHQPLRGDAQLHSIHVSRPLVPKYVEYLPALLLLMRLLESAGASQILLGTSSAALLFARVLHGIGVARFAPRLCNVAGAIGTTMLVVLCASYGLAIEGRLF